MADVIIRLHYLEMNGQLKKVLAVIKARDTDHSKEFRLYDISERGCVIGRDLKGYEGILSGQPRRIDGTEAGNGKNLNLS